MTDSRPTKNAAPGGTCAAACWPPLEEIDGETEQLVSLVETGWAWQWPGWKWVAASLNHEYGNDRTAQGCRAKYKRIVSKANASNQAEPRERR